MDDLAADRRFLARRARTSCGAMLDARASMRRAPQRRPAVRRRRGARGPAPAAPATKARRRWSWNGRPRTCARRPAATHFPLPARRDRRWRPRCSIGARRLDASWRDHSRRRRRSAPSRRRFHAGLGGGHRRRRPPRRRAARRAHRRLLPECAADRSDASPRLRAAGFEPLWHRAGAAERRRARARPGGRGRRGRRARRATPCA